MPTVLRYGHGKAARSRYLTSVSDGDAHSIVRELKGSGGSPKSAGRQRRLAGSSIEVPLTSTPGFNGLKVKFTSRNPKSK